MGNVQVRSIENPDENREFPNGMVAMITVGGVMAARTRFEPGWHWSESVKPIAGTSVDLTGDERGSGRPAAR